MKFILFTLLCFSCTLTPPLKRASLKLVEFNDFLVSNSKSIVHFIEKNEKANVLNVDLFVKNIKQKEVMLNLKKSFFELKAERFPTECFTYRDKNSAPILKFNEIIRVVCKVTFPKYHKFLSNTDSEGYLSISLLDDSLILPYKLRMEDFQ